MERSNGGWRVELILTPSGRPAITLRRGDDAETETTLIPPESALDAFEHPCCYLPRA
jgi:hypothetical protein